MDRATPTALRRNLYWIAILPLLLIPASGWLLSHKPKDQPALFWTGAALFVAGIGVLWVALSSRYHRLTVGGPSTLDERELALRYRTSTAAFSIYALITVLGCVYLRSARWLGLPAPAGAGWLWVMIVLGNLFALLPIIILEWSADSLASEEEE